MTLSRWVWVAAVPAPSLATHLAGYAWLYASTYPNDVSGVVLVDALSEGLIAALAGGCFQPLYGEQSPTGGSVLREQLSAVDVLQIQAPKGSDRLRFQRRYRGACRCFADERENPAYPPNPSSSSSASEHSDEEAAYVRRMEQVGRCVAELQLALASRDDVIDFAPEPITAEDVRGWTNKVLHRANRTLDELARRRSDLRDNDRQLVDELLSRRRTLPDRLGELLPATVQAMKIRHHGDFHLGQMLIVKDDVFIIDFEGEPRRFIVFAQRIGGD